MTILFQGGGNYLLEVLSSNPSCAEKNLIPGLMVPAVFAFPPPFSAP